MELAVCTLILVHKRRPAEPHILKDDLLERIEKIVAATPARAGHEERGLRRVHAVLLDQTHHIPGHEGAGQALLPVEAAAAPFEAPLVGRREEFGVDAVRPERGGPHRHAVGGMGQIQHAIAAGIEFDLARAPGRDLPRGVEVRHRVKERLAARDHARLGGMLVDLKQQERLFAHFPDKETRVHGIVDAAEIRQIDGVEPRVPPDDVGGGKRALPHRKRHIAPRLAHIRRMEQIQQIAGDGLDAHAPQDAGKVHVGAGIVDVVGLAHQHHGLAVRPQSVERLPAEGVAGLAEPGLRGIGLIAGAPHLRP